MSLLAFVRLLVAELLGDFEDSTGGRLFLALGPGAGQADELGPVPRDPGGAARAFERHLRPLSRPRGSHGSQFSMIRNFEPRAKISTEKGTGRPDRRPRSMIRSGNQRQLRGRRERQA